MTTPSTTGKRPRILLVVSSGDIGGGQLHALELGRRLKNDVALEPHAVCHPHGALEQHFSDLHIPTMGLELERIFDIGDVFRFASHIKNGGFDLIHAHLNRAALWSVLFGKLFRIPVIATAHGLTKSRYYRFANHIIAVSNAVKKHLLSRNARLESKLSVIHNGVVLEATINSEIIRKLKEQYLIRDADKIITVIGKLHQNKGQELAIRALKHLPSSLRVRLFLVGDGPERSRLERLVSVLSLGPLVTFIPSQQRVQEIYHLSDIVLVPSHREALSYVCLEALRQARPVIASNTGGIPEIIEHGKTGMLVAPGDAVALAKAIQDGFKSYRRLEAMAQYGKRKVMNHFGIDQWFQRTMEVYSKTLGSKRM